MLVLEWGQTYRKVVRTESQGLAELREQIWQRMSSTVVGIYVLEVENVKGLRCSEHCISVTWDPI